MAQRKRRGFTIVELVIVIAVIAILAGVLIPTFISVINKANVASDTSLVKNINEALIAEEVTEGKPATMYEALQLAEKNGFSVEKLTPRSTGDIVWDSATNRFALVNGNDTVYSFNNEPISTGAKIWKIVADAAAAEKNTENSSYIKGQAHYSSLSVKTGVDVGENTVESIVYTGNESAKEIVIRTNHGETNIEVNGAKDTVKHYGTANLVKVVAVDPTNSYHEFGSVKTLQVANGHIVLENNSLVFELTKTESSNATFVSNGTVIKNTANAENVTVANTYDIYTLEQLCAFRDYVNAGMDFSNLPVEIKADIDMSSISWMPIGTGEHPFNGVIRGNSHTLSGLTNGTIVSTKDAFTTSTTKTYGAAYGFIAVAGAINNEHAVLEVTNLKLANVDIQLSEYGSCVGALVGYAPKTGDFADAEKFNNASGKGIENITIKGVIVSGTVSGNATVGGIVGKLYNTGSVTIEDCSNSAAVIANQKAGGIAGYISGKERLQTNGVYNVVNVTLKNLSNSGTVTAASDKVGGIVSYLDVFCAPNNATENLPTVHVVIENCSNSGAISGGDGCTGVGGILYSIQGLVTGSYKVSSASTVTITGCSNSGVLTNANNSSSIILVCPDKTSGVSIAITNK